MDEQGKRIIAQHEERVRRECREAYLSSFSADAHIGNIKQIAAMSDLNLDHCEGENGCPKCPLRPPEPVTIRIHLMGDFADEGLPVRMFCIKHLEEE